MKIQYASQLFRAAQHKPLSQLIKPAAPTLVLAGNCVQPHTRAGRDFLRDLSLAFDTVCVVPGPAEYGSNPRYCYAQNLTELYHAVYKHQNMRILDNRAYDLNKKTLLAGTTLWHNLSGISTPVRDMVGVNTKYKMADKQTVFDMINKAAVANMFMQGRDFLRSIVLNDDNTHMNIAFGTYHVPTYNLLTDSDKADYNTAVMANNELFYCEAPLKVWIAGAGAGSAVFKKNDVLFVKNSYGMEEDPSPSFVASATVEVVA